MNRLLVIGDVVTDVLALHTGPVAAGTDTPADIVVLPGGSAANTAAWAASLGAPVTLLARVGADTGDWHRAQLIAAGVRPVLSVDPDRPTAVIVVMVDGSGERTMLTNRGAGELLGPGDWDDTLLDGVGHLHLSGYLLFAPQGRRLAALAISRARGRGLTLSVDPASTGFLRRFGVANFTEATAGVDVILPNQSEAVLLTGEGDPGTAAAKLSQSYGMAVVKLGGDGAMTARDGLITARVGGTPVTAIDSTGAGDAFAAGFLVAHLGGADDATALSAGRAAGSAAVTRVSGRPA
ncbi:MAG: PfkB family carbohydrate kinase [Streptosporangiaceae bacterium]